MRGKNMAKRASWIVLGVALVCSGFSSEGQAAGEIAPARGRARADGGALSWPDRIAIERALAEHDPVHQPRIESGSPRLGETASFDARGARVVVDRGEVAIGLVAIGREGALRELGVSPAATIAGPEVRIARAAGVVEWWRSLPSGLEQGVTIAERPKGAGPLMLDITTGDDTTPSLASDNEVVLHGAQNEVIARYAHLVVLDAAGARMPARLAVVRDRIRIEVDDSVARYPLVVDPLVTVEEATLLAPDGRASDYFGQSVALSSDGSRALVGAPQSPIPGDGGFARIFVRTGATWTEEAIVSGSGAFGCSVALSADGSRALIGAYLADTAGGIDAGRARVYLRSGTTWAARRSSSRSCRRDVPHASPGTPVSLPHDDASEGRAWDPGLESWDTWRSQRRVGEVSPLLQTGP
jgi:hypothetical protein